jgi:hypothetical protein
VAGLEAGRVVLAEQDVRAARHDHELELTGREHRDVLARRDVVDHLVGADLNPGVLPGVVAGDAHTQELHAVGLLEPGDPGGVAGAGGERRCGRVGREIGVDRTAEGGPRPVLAQPGDAQAEPVAGVDVGGGGRPGDPLEVVLDETDVDLAQVAAHRRPRLRGLRRPAPGGDSERRYRGRECPASPCHPSIPSVVRLLR